MESSAIRPGGLNRYFDDLADELERMGVTVQRIRYCSEVSGPDAMKSGLLRRLFFYLQAGFKDTSDVVDSHFALYGLAFMAGKFLHNPFASARVITHFQGPWFAESVLATGRRRLANNVKYLVEKIAYRRSDVFVVLSREFEKTLIHTFGIEPERVCIIPPGVDTEKFSPPPDGIVRSQGESRDGTATICAVRRLDHRMGLDIAVRAVALLDQRVELKIAGDGRERDALRALADQIGVAERVHLLGRLKDHEIVDLYRSSTCSVVPTRALEGYGLVVLESLGCGTPVIASRTGGLIDALEEFDETLLVEPESPAALANRIEDLLAGQRPTLDSCRQRALAQTWHAIARRHIESAYGLADSVNVRDL
ncbi:glycosyltransferase family 4 protein [Rhodococcoides kroppenstedtii]